MKKTISREPRVCANPQCSVEFVPRQYNHRFCSEECRIQEHGFQSKGEMLKGIKQKQMMNVRPGIRYSYQLVYRWGNLSINRFIIRLPCHPVSGAGKIFSEDHKSKSPSANGAFKVFIRNDRERTKSFIRFDQGNYTLKSHNFKSFSFPVGFILIQSGSDRWINQPKI